MHIKDIKKDQIRHDLLELIDMHLESGNLNQIKNTLDLALDKNQVKLFVLSNRFRKLPLQRIKWEMNETNFFL